MSDAYTNRRAVSTGRICLSMVAVDGVSHILITTRSKPMMLKALEAVDHVGTSLSLVADDVTLNEAHKIYQFLQE